MEKTQPMKSLRPKVLGFWSIVFFAVGGMIGTWIVDMTYWFQLSGSGSFWALMLAGVLVFPLALCYSELTSMLPFAAGETVWVGNAFGWVLSWITGWGIYLLYLLALTWVIYGVGTIALFTFPSMSFSTIRLIGLGLLTAWLIISLLKIEVSGNLSVIMCVVMIAAAIIGFFAFFTSGKWDYANLTPWFPHGVKGFTVLLGILMFKFVGFDLIPQYAEEANYPRKDQWKAYVAAILINLGIYGTAILANGGIWSWEKIANATLIDPNIAQELGYHFIALLIIITAILSVITVIPGFWAAGSRILFGLARQGLFPSALTKLNKNGQPWVANIAVYVFAVYFAFFSPEAWVEYIYTIFSFTAGAVFLLVSLSYIALLIKRPDWERPYKAPGGLVTGFIAAAYCVLTIIAALSEITKEGVAALGIFYLIGLIVFAYCHIQRRKGVEKYQIKMLTPADIDEKAL